MTSQRNDISLSISEISESTKKKRIIQGTVDVIGIIVVFLAFALIESFLVSLIFNYLILFIFN